MSRFPFFAKIFKMAMPKVIEKLVEDTKTHEAYTLALIKKFVPRAFCLSRIYDLMFLSRRIQNPSARSDFLTKMLENASVELSEVQIAAHASDFV